MAEECKSYGSVRLLVFIDTFSHFQPFSAIFPFSAKSWLPNILWNNFRTVATNWPVKPSYLGTYLQTVSFEVVLVSVFRFLVRRKCSEQGCASLSAIARLGIHKHIWKLNVWNYSTVITIKYCYCLGFMLIVKLVFVIKLKYLTITKDYIIFWFMGILNFAIIWRSVLQSVVRSKQMTLEKASTCSLGSFCLS